MTLLEMWVRTPLARSLGLALVHSLWEGVLIAVMLAAALYVARSSRARYGAACVAMLLMLASFSVTLILLRPQPIELAKTHAPVLVPSAPVGLPIAPGEALPAPSGLAAFLPWMAPFWAAGVLLFHLRALGGWMAARRLRLSGVCRAPDEWQQHLDGLAARLRVSKPATLMESCFAEVPVVIGYLRPVILMPVGLLAGLPVAQVEAILVHELAHIRRQDYLVNLMQTFVEGLLFYHPAVWWISGVIRAERENCCDDLAVAATGDARQFAAALAALEQNRWSAHELALAATGGSLVKRIRRLLQQPERPSAAWTPAIAAGLLMISAGIAFASWQTPPKPRAPAPAALPAPAAPAAPVAVELPPVRIKRAAPVLLAQAQQAPRTPQDTLAVEQQLQDAVQLPNPYRKWLNEDVAYIITAEERKAFKGLTNREERENFIQQFWQVRDPTPGTPENECKDEHYRRIAYANEHFTTAADLPGWKTDRGRIYITYGPPDEIEDHSSGGAYTRPPEEGGGATSTVPFQQWRYRFIDSIGNNIIIEFVDPTYTKEFRMTADPSEKDALRYIPGAAPAPANAGTPNQTEFKRRQSKIQSKDASVNAQPSPALAKFPQAANIFVSVGEGPKVTVSVTAETVNTYVGFPLPSAPAKYDIIGQISDANNRTVANVRDVTAVGQANYMTHFTIKPGSYTLKLVVRDPASGEMQTSAVSFYVN